VLAAAALVGGALAVALGPTSPGSPRVALAQTRPCAERLDATYYHPSLAGEAMANGRPYDPRNPRLASSNRHRLGTVLLLRRADGAAAVVVEIMDRGSTDLGLDLSEAAFQRLGSLQEGRIPVCVEVVR
jgi:rare lipoprotein A (peptidoglycan hydrolase)